MLITRGPGTLQPLRRGRLGDGVGGGDVGLEVQDGGAVPGVQMRHFHHVSLDLDDPAGGEADEVGALRGPAGENPGQGVGRVASGVHLESPALLRCIILVEPVKYPEMREVLQAFQGRGEFRIDFQPGAGALLFHHPDGMQTDGFNGVSPGVLRFRACVFSIAGGLK